MKPSTNFKLAIGIFLLLFCVGAFYLLARDFNARSNNISDPDYGDRILENTR